MSLTLNSADETLFVWSVHSCYVVCFSKFWKMKLGVFFSISNFCTFENKSGILLCMIIVLPAC